jgi:hypothetical protein
MAGEGDNAVFDAHANVGGVDVGLELKLFQNGFT